MAATCLLMGTAIAANETPQKVTSSTPEGVTYGVDQKYKAPPDTSRYANIKTAAGCVALLVLIGSVPFIVTRAGKRKEKDGNSEKEYVETSHKEAVHRIVDTNQRYRAYIEQSNDKGYNPEMQKAHDYVVHWSEMKAKSIGLLLWGDVGTGKSFFAGCIANALLEQGVPVLMTNFSRILNALSGLYSEEKNQYIDSLNQYSLLIIDDLGIERSTEFALEQVFNVIDSRYRSKLPLIVTTNMTLEELKNPQDLTRSRIYDRVLERCVPLRINNQNIRQRNAAESMKEARKILESGTGT